MWAELGALFGGVVAVGLAMLALYLYSTRRRAGGGGAAATAAPPALSRADLQQLAARVEKLLELPTVVASLVEEDVPALLRELEDALTASERAAAAAKRSVALSERLARERDALDIQLDEVAQRLRRCTCGVGMAIAQELELGPSEERA